jgi:class 3 adenylate cyclase
VADELLRTGFSLGGKFVDATVLFADIRSYSTYAEKEDPVEIIELLNNYFALMFDAITSHHGTVNQMVGDGLMAIFGAPIPHEAHREQAVRAAIEMKSLLDGFNQEQALLNKTQIQIGIGIATGRMIAGYTGTQHRATYTCIGDTVNIAKRIEDHTKTVGYPILIDQYTREGLPVDIEVRPLGAILFRGKQQPIQTYAIKG